MVQLLCLFAPAYFAVWIFEKMQKRKLKIKDFIFVYVFFAVLVNTICFGVISIIFKHPDYVIDSQVFNVQFSIKYLFLALFFAVVLLTVYKLFQTINLFKERASFSLEANEKRKICFAINFSFVFTTLIFIPYDIFFANSSDFAFSFSDFWWIIASFAFSVFIVLMIVFMLLPKRVFMLIESLLFSLTLLFYIQRMFLNFYVTAVTGDMLETAEHPIWGFVNLLIWFAVIIAVWILFYAKNDFWKKMLYFVSSGLILVQGIALVSLLVTGDLISVKGSTEQECLTTDGLYELATDNNIIVFVLDYYDFTYFDAVRNSDPDFYDQLEGFTYFDNTSSVYSRTYPSVPYLLTGVELDEFHSKPYKESINKAFETSSFIPALRELGFEIGFYTNEAYIGEASYQKSIISNFSKEKRSLRYWATLKGLLKCSLYFETPYLIKPFFWIYEINSTAVRGNQYIIDDAKLNTDLLESGLSVSDTESMYKFIHMHGAHSPYTLNEDGERIPTGVEDIQQWKGCVNIVYKYLEEMKSLGKYDSATIIITADHGRMSGTGELKSEVGPIMFIKPAYALSNDLQISHAPISHTDIFPTIIEAAGGNYSNYGKPIFSIEEDENRTRVFHYSSRVNSSMDKEILDYDIPQNIKDFDNWKIKSIRKVLESIYGVYR